MTTAVQIAPRARAAGSPPPRRRPRGVPSWLWLLGVTIEPVGRPRPDGTRAWMVAAGMGPANVSALFFDAVVEPETTDSIDRLPERMTR